MTLRLFILGFFLSNTQLYYNNYVQHNILWNKDVGTYICFFTLGVVFTNSRKCQVSKLEIDKSF